MTPRNKSRELPVGDSGAGSGRDQPRQLKINYIEKNEHGHVTPDCARSGYCRLGRQQL
jgi:hypothetical protein